MEELGIGRPSTYASILQVLKDRKYVRLDKRRLVPEDNGRVVVAFLESFFARYVEYDFTADLEEQLDRVSNAEVDWREVLRDFWRDFIAAVGEIKDLRISQVLDALNEMLAPHIFPPRADGADPRLCTVCGTGQLSLKLGKFGAFIGCSNYPECKNTRPLVGVRRRRRQRDQGARPGSRDRPRRHAARPGGSGPTSSSAKARTARSRSAPDCRRAPIPPRSISRWRSSSCRCRARSAGIRKTASRSSPASAASVRMSSTARPTPISTPATTCSISASTAR